MNGNTKNWRINSVSSVDIHLRVYLVSTLHPFFVSVFLWLFAGTRHPAFRLGPKFRNHQACRAWMGARLPFRNTYHKGFSLFMGQARYYAPEAELAVRFDGGITILFTITSSLTLSECSSLSPRFKYHIFFTLWFSSYSPSIHSSQYSPQCSLSPRAYVLFFLFTPTTAPY